LPCADGAGGDDAAADAYDGRMFEISFDARLGERYAAVLNLQMVNDQLELEWIEAPSVVSADSEFIASPEIRLDALNNARQSSGQGNSIQLKDPSTELLGDDRLPLAAWIARFACDPRRSRMQNWVGPEELSPLYVREKVAQTISERLVTPDLVWSPMRLNDLASVMVIENQAYPFPWTSGNFTDSLTAGYEMSVLKEQNVMVGYLVWMAVVDEAHLLNIALSPARQGRGLGLWMMRYFIAQARTREFSKILLEVRPSNHGAIRLYRFLGFQKIGQRKGYYPQSAGLVSASAEKALWANIARAARRLGIDAQYLDGAAIASGHQIDLCVSELVDQQPECVLLFGESLLQEIKRIRPELLEGRQLIVCDDFSTLTAQSTRKSAVWQALVKLRSVLHSSPQS